MSTTERTLFSAGFSEAYLTAAHDALALRYREAIEALRQARWMLSEYGGEAAAVEVERRRRVHDELAAKLTVYRDLFDARLAAERHGDHDTEIRLVRAEEKVRTMEEE